MSSAMLLGSAVTAGRSTRNEIVPASSFDTVNAVMSNPAPASPAGSPRLLVAAAPASGTPTPAAIAATPATPAAASHPRRLRTRTPSAFGAPFTYGSAEPVNRGIALRETPRDRGASLSRPDRRFGRRPGGPRGPAPRRRRPRRRRRGSGWGASAAPARS